MTIKFQKRTLLTISDRSKTSWKISLGDEVEVRILHGEQEISSHQAEVLDHEGSSLTIKIISTNNQGCYKKGIEMAGSIHKIKEHNVFSALKRRVC